MSTIRSTCGRILRSVYGHYCQLKPIEEFKIVLESFGGRNYSDSPKEIAEEILREKKEWKLVWLSGEKPANMPSSIKWVRYGSFSAIKEWATANLWIDNVRHQSRPKKRDDQFYMQTWHAPFSVKCIEKDAEDKLDRDYVESAKYDGSITDAILSNSRLLDEVYERAFWLSPKTEILRYGFPRNDKLIRRSTDIEYRNRIREKLKIDESDYVVLYAPTFRDDASTDGYIKSFDGVVDAIANKFGREAVVLVRLHPVAYRLASFYQYNTTVRDVTNYPDVQDLVLASDCCISDYSSTVFDFSMIDKPVFICALDIDHYNELRGLLPVFYKLPYPLARTEDELRNHILEYNESHYFQQCSQFFTPYPVYDSGNAAERTVAYIQQLFEKTNDSRGSL